MTREQRAIVAALRSVVTTEAVAIGACDWPRALALAEELGVLPMLQVLARDPAVPMPDTTRDTVREAYYTQAAINANLLDQLGQIVAALGDAGVRCMLLKGAALLDGAYDDLAFRPMADLDLLIEPSDHEPAARALGALGYVPDESFAPQSWYEASLHHWAPYVCPDRGVNLELHRALLPPGAPFPIGTAPLWLRAQPSTAVPGALVPDPADQLLHVALHLAWSDRFCGSLRGLVDLGVLVRRHGAHLDWHGCADRVHALAASRELFFACDLARHLVSAAMPDRILAALADTGRISTVNRRLVRPVLTRAALAVEGECRVPPWLLASAATNLVRRGPSPAAGARIVAATVRGYYRSASRRPGVPRALRPAYAVLVHPLYLMLRRR